MLSKIESVITISVVVLGTMITRFLPFVLFPQGKPIPSYIKYLGDVLPFATTGLLIVYCLKEVSFITSPFGAPEVIAIIFIVIVHSIKRNMLLSIGLGTALYMVLVQNLFK